MSFEKAGMVSIWLTQVLLDESADMRRLCGIEYYDVDQMEVVGDLAKQQPVEDLLKSASYSGSFMRAATAAAKKANLTNAYTAILLYDFEYDPRQVSVKMPPGLLFLGAFAWNDRKS